MASDPAVKPLSLLVAVIVIATTVVGVLVVVNFNPFGERKTDTGELPIDPALIGYKETAALPVALRQVSALAVGPTGALYVGGDTAVHVLDGQGAALRPPLALAEQPTCLAVGGKDHPFPGRLYVGFKDHVEVFDPSGQRLVAWPPPAEKAVFTSMAVGEEDVFVADAANRIVWQYHPDGGLKGRIGDPDPARQITGFVITDLRYFDLAVGPGGVIYVVNPRLLRVEGYNTEGHRVQTWGRGSPRIEEFFGCCNPAQLAVLSDGSFVTAEKGALRVKVHSPRGEFRCVVVASPQLAAVPADLAGDQQDRVLVLDRVKKSVRIFERIDDQRANQPLASLHSTSGLATTRTTRHEQTRYRGLRHYE